MATTKWQIDAAHSEVQFKVKHMMISTVTGYFNSFDASVETEGDDFTTAKVNFTADVNSISTNNEQRDAHLKNSDFFDAENHPELTFKSERIEKISDDEYKMEGILTIRGISKKLVLIAEYGGIMTDPWGNTRIGWSATTKINRKDYGLTWNAALEAGGFLVGDEVTITLDVQAVKS